MCRIQYWNITLNYISYFRGNLRKLSFKKLHCKQYDDIIYVISVGVRGEVVC